MRIIVMKDGKKLIDAKNGTVSDEILDELEKTHPTETQEVKSVKLFYGKKTTLTDFLNDVEPKKLVLTLKA